MPSSLCEVHIIYSIVTLLTIHFDSNELDGMHTPLSAAIPRTTSALIEKVKTDSTYRYGPDHVFQSCALWLGMVLSGKSIILCVCGWVCVHVHASVWVHMHTVDEENGLSVSSSHQTGVNQGDKRALL